MSPGSAPRVAQQGAVASQALGAWRDGEVPRMVVVTVVVNGGGASLHC